MVGGSANRQFGLRLIGYILGAVYRSCFSIAVGASICAVECYYSNSAISAAGFLDL